MQPLTSARAAVARRSGRHSDLPSGYSKKRPLARHYILPWGTGNMHVNHITGLDMAKLSGVRNGLRNKSCRVGNGRNNVGKRIMRNANDLAAS